MMCTCAGEEVSPQASADTPTDDYRCPGPTHGGRPSPTPVALKKAGKGKMVCVLGTFVCRSCAPGWARAHSPPSTPLERPAAAPQRRVGSSTTTSTARNDLMARTELENKCAEMRKEIKRLGMRLHRRDRAKEKAVDEAKRLQAEATTARADEQQATEALAQTQEQLAAILEFNQEAEARGFGDIFSAISGKFASGALEWDGFVIELLKTLASNSLGSNGNDYSERLMEHMSILRDATSPQQLLRQLNLWVPLPDPGSTIRRYQDRTDGDERGAQGYRAPSMPSYETGSENYLSSLNDLGFADGGKEPGTEAAESAHRLAVSNAATAEAALYPRFTAPGWRLINPKPEYAMKGDAMNIAPQLSESFTYDSTTDTYTVELVGDHWVPAIERPPPESWVLQHEAADEQAEMMASLLQQTLRSIDSREVDLAAARHELQEIETTFAQHLPTMQEHQLLMEQWAQTLRRKLTSTAQAQPAEDASAETLSKKHREWEKAQQASADAKADCDCIGSAQALLARLRACPDAVAFKQQLSTQAVTVRDAVVRLFRHPPPQRERKKGEPFRLAAHSVHLLRVHDANSGAKSVVAGMLFVSSLKHDATASILRDACSTVSAIGLTVADGAEAQLRETMDGKERPETRKAVAQLAYETMRQSIATDDATRAQLAQEERAAADAQRRVAAAMPAVQVTAQRVLRSGQDSSSGGLATVAVTSNEMSVHCFIDKEKEHSYDRASGVISGTTLTVVDAEANPKQRWTIGTHKRKRDACEVGQKVEMLFDDGVWYPGSVESVSGNLIDIGFGQDWQPERRVPVLVGAIPNPELRLPSGEPVAAPEPAPDQDPPDASAAADDMVIDTPASVNAPSPPDPARLALVERWCRVVPPQQTEETTVFMPKEDWANVSTVGTAYPETQRCGVVDAASDAGVTMPVIGFDHIDAEFPAAPALRRSHVAVATDGLSVPELSASDAEQLRVEVREAQGLPTDAAVSDGVVRRLHLLRAAAAADSGVSLAALKPELTQAIFEREVSKRGLYYYEANADARTGKPRPHLDDGNHMMKNLMAGVQRQKERVLLAVATDARGQGEAEGAVDCDANASVSPAPIPSSLGDSTAQPPDDRDERSSQQSLSPPTVPSSPPTGPAPSTSPPAPFDGAPFDGAVDAAEILRVAFTDRAKYKGIVKMMLGQTQKQSVPAMRLLMCDRRFHAALWCNGARREAVFLNTMSDAFDALDKGHLDPCYRDFVIDRARYLLYRILGSAIDDAERLRVCYGKTFMGIEAQLIFRLLSTFDAREQIVRRNGTYFVERCAGTDDVENTFSEVVAEMGYMATGKVVQGAFRKAERRASAKMKDNIRQFVSSRKRYPPCASSPSPLFHFDRARS